MDEVRIGMHQHLRSGVDTSSVNRVQMGRSSERSEVGRNIRSWSRVISVALRVVVTWCQARG